MNSKVSIRENNLYLYVVRMKFQATHKYSCLLACRYIFSWVGGKETTVAASSLEVPHTSWHLLSLYTRMCILHVSTIHPCVTVGRKRFWILARACALTYLTDCCAFLTFALSTTFFRSALSSLATIFLCFCMFALFIY